MSKEVKRYEPASGHDSVMRVVEWMRETPAGGWVSHDDYDALLAERQWISVEDRLPGVDFDGCALSVVVLTSQGRVVSETDAWIQGKGFDFWGLRVTHWMPLPAPPAMQGEQP